MSELTQNAANNSLIDTEVLSNHRPDSINFEYFIDKNNRTETLVHLFADKFFGASAYEAIRLLQPATDLFDGSAEHRRSAASAISDYLNSPECGVRAEDMDYVASLLGDIPVINQCAANYLVRLESLIDEDPMNKAKDVLASLNGESAIPREYWDELRFGINLPEVTKLAEQANVESVMIMAAAAVDKLMATENGSPEQLRTILEIETFYAPLVDALGLSAFDMTLRNEANKARLIAGNNEDLVYSAREDLAGVEDGIPPIMQAFFVQAEGSPIFEVNTCMLNGDRIYFGEKCLESLTGGKWSGRFIDRIKTIGSLAHKRVHNEQYRTSLPQDVIGLTAVMENEAEMISFFEFIYDTIDNSEKMKFKAASSKEGKVISLQGTEAYVQSIMGQLDDDHAANVKKKVIKKEIQDTFQVLKVTFDIVLDDGRQIPVEFQFQTNTDRFNSRLGGASHIHYKGLKADENASELSTLLDNIAGSSRDLETINGRKEDLYAINPSMTIYIENESAIRFREAMLSGLNTI